MSWLLEKACSTSLVTGSLDCFEFWLNRYQTLIGALVAVGAALLAFVAVRSQIAQADRLTEERRRRAHEAARSVLPFALNDVCVYASECMSALEAYRETRRTEMADNAALTPPPFPRETVEVLRSAVEHASPQHAAEISDLLAVMQVFLANIDGPVRGDADIQNAMFDSADLYERASRLFRYARGEINRHLVTGDDIRHALKLARITLKMWPLTVGRIELLENAAKKKTSAS